MTVEELRIGRDGLTTARVNDLHDAAGHISITTESGASSMVLVLSRADQQFLLLYLRERLGESR